MFIDEYYNEFQSSSGPTPQWKRFFNNTSKEFGEVLKNNSMKLSRCHFFFFGFFTDDTGQAWYFSIPDVRFKTTDDMLIRIAVNYEDFTGGPNQYINIDKNFWDNFKNYIKGEKE